MTQIPRPRKRTLAERFYTVCLRLYPPSHRRAYGPQMLQTFRDSVRDVQVTQGKIGMRFWLDTLSDEIKSVLREHGTDVRAAAQRVRQQRLAMASGMLLGGAIVYVAMCVM
jgi:hypothetical protein